MSDSKHTFPTRRHSTSWARRTATALGLALATLAANPAAAQDFDARIQQDPRVRGATYQFHFNGPPLGQAALVLGTELTLPLPIFPFGVLLVRPVVVTPLLPLDPRGMGQAQFQIPLADQPVTLTCQAVMIDQANNIRITQRARSLVNAEVPKYGFGYMLAHDHGSNTLAFRFRGNPQGNVRITIRRGNGKLVTKIVPFGANGEVSGTVNVAIQPGDRWSVVYTDPTIPAGVGRSAKF